MEELERFRAVFQDFAARAPLALVAVAQRVGRSSCWGKNGWGETHTFNQKRKKKGAPLDFVLTGSNSRFNLSVFIWGEYWGRRRAHDTSVAN